MATTSAPQPHFRVERLPTPTPPSELNLTKQPQPQPQAQLSITDTTDIPPPPFINSITGLRSLSNALSTFLGRYDELSDHLDFIKSSIDFKLRNHNLDTTTNSNQLTLIPLDDTSPPAPVKTAVPETDITIQNTKETATNGDEKPDIPKKKPALSELENLCEMMCGRSVKRYVITHISDTDKLHEEVPKALKLAKDPAKLVLDSIGRFYVQGSKAYTKSSPMIAGRLACIMILECFLLMSNDGIEIAKAVEEDAAKAAVDWRKRMITEGGLAKADEIDARGLLLLISGFGIPNNVFKNEDIRDLIRAGNVKEISTALRRSVILIPKIPEIIDWMVKNNMEIDAVDIAYTFGLEDKCPPRTILTAFLRNNVNDKPKGSPAEVRDAIKKQLAVLKSMTKCLETHNVDPSKLLPEWKINEKIPSLEKEMSELDSEVAEDKTTQKRKAKETESSNKSKQQEGKRSRFSGHNNVPHEHKVVDRGDGKSSYNGLTSASTYFDGRLPSNHVNVYSTSSSVLHGSRLPENITSSVAVGSGGGLNGGGMLPSSYGGGVYVGTITDQMVNKANGQPYDWRRDAALIERYVGQAYQSQTQKYDPQPSSPGLIGLYSRPSGSTLEGFPGLPNPISLAGVSARGGSGSDLYHFADSVVENETHRSSAGTRAPRDGNMHPFLSSHRSYLY